MRESGFSRIHTAAIMGNLRQEHNFKTDDVPGGLGIAQWMGARRDRLIAKGNYLEIRTQLEFIIEEFHTTESLAYKSIMASSAVEDATIAFQNKYERCHVNYCMPDQRISYAKQYLEKYQ